MSYIIDKETELEIAGRKKVFKINVEYQWDIYIKTYLDKFTVVKNPNFANEIILDCGSSLDKENVLTILGLDS